MSTVRARICPEKRLKVLEEAKELLHRKIVAGKDRAEKRTGGKKAA